MKKYEKNNKKNISENIDPRGSGPVPFGSASQTAKKNLGEKISPKILILELGTGAIRRGLGEKISPKILILEQKK